MGGITMRRLLERFGSAAAVPKLTAVQLAEVQGIGPDKARWLVQAFADAHACNAAGRETALAETQGVTLVTWGDKDYPAPLMSIPAPPLVLYVKGSTAPLHMDCVAVVGTRQPTIYGRETARRFGYGLGTAGYCVVSGLARGVDSEAHEGALQAGAKTVAVIGAALDRIYPREQEPLARRIAEAGGAIVSEYPFGRQADRQTFPMRNRIVAGLSRGVLAVEAPNRSGTLITTTQANEYNRTVMAVPGRIDSPKSEGCNKLIREGATLVTCVDDVIGEVDSFFNRCQPRGKAGTPATPQREIQLSQSERDILAALDDSDGGCLADAIAERCRIPAHLVAASLVSLEMKRLVRVHPGGLAVRATPKI